MSIYKGTTLIAGISTHTNENAHSLFDFKWTDHKLNDVSWLEASIFSWQSGDVYTSAYNHLAQDIQGITAETETIGSYTVTFYRATDGHKICLADQEQTVLNIYNETGIAWYYILDTTNTQFKLPRTKYGFEGLRTNVGDEINESLPNITGTGQMRCWGPESCAGAFEDISGGTAKNGTDSKDRYLNFKFDASRSSSTYQDNAPVQERATQMYLYFYVGDYSQTAIEQTAGLNSELFNDKADTDLSNATDKGKILMSSMGLPSKTYIDLTLGASGSTYTAPANGFVTISKTTNGTNQYLFIHSKLRTQGSANPSNFDLELFCPINKGEQFTINYNAGGATKYFRFYYAQGSESEAN